MATDEGPTGFTPELAERQTAVYRRSAGLLHELTAAEAAERAGLDLDMAVEVLRSFGLPDVKAGELRAFDGQDVETLQAIKILLDVGFEREDLIAVARVYGQAFSRIAEAEQRVFRKQILDPMIQAGATVEQIDAMAPMSQLLVSLLEAPILNAHRRQLDIAIRQLVVTASEGGTEPTAVGFVDLVNYSALVATLEGIDLTRLISRFDELATRCCAAAQARVVKLVGDAVLFVASEAGPALDAAEAVVTASAQDDVLPSARAGLDFGDVLPLEGDYFGNPVNVAARIVAVAAPDTVVVSKAFAGALGPGAPDLHSLGAHDLKGVGSTDLFRVDTRR